MTLNVRQRQFAIGKRGSSVSTVDTAYLGPRIAFYGVDAERGLVFLSHLDFHAVGLDRLISDLKEHTEGDLSGFEVYLTTGMSWWFRLLIAALGGCVAKLVVPHSRWSVYGAVFTAVGATILFFWSQITLYYYLRKSKTFSIGHIRHLKTKRPLGFRRSGVKLDANSDLVQTGPYCDVRADSKSRFEAIEESCVVRPISRAEGSLRHCREGDTPTAPADKAS